MVPILPAATAGPSSGQTGAPATGKSTGEVPSWRQAPPPPRRSTAPDGPPAGAAPGDPSDWRNAPPPARHSSGPPEEDVVEVMPEEEAGVPDWQNAPPVRRGGGGVVQEEPQEEAIEVLAEEEPIRPRSKKGRNLIFIGIVILLLGGAIGAAVFVMSQVQGEREEALAKEARTAYTESRFADAFTKFDQLGKDFPSSDHLAEYRFLADLADLRGEFTSLNATPDSVLEKQTAFLKNNESNPLLKEHAAEFGPDFVQWLANRIDALAKDEADAKNAGGSGLEFMARAKETLHHGQQIVAEAFKQDDVAKVDEAFQKVEIVLQKRKERREAIAKLQNMKPTAQGIKEARNLIKATTKKHEAFDQDPDVQAALTKLYQGHLDSVRYVDGADAAPASGRSEDREPSMVVNHLVQGVAPERRPNDPIFLALVRGVLYALSQSNGEIIWAMRVGIDTSALPVRVPASEGRPEMVLALSADTETLTGLNAATGDQLWKYRLSAPCLAQPVVVGLRAYVPTYDGSVHEVELARGQLIGRYELGQHLTVGGSRQDRTDLVYFPADDECVYILDVKNHRCQGILHSGHPSGSLRTTPIVINTDTSGAGYLILPQTDGLESTALRAFTLPLEGVQMSPPAVQSQSTHGWPWFPPFHDPEKLVLVTDAGAVGVFGIHQERTQDTALFPMVRDEFRLPSGDSTRPNRAQVVACQDDTIWVLAKGGLQKLKLIMNPVKGPQLAVDPLWKQPLLLGSPLHRSQVEMSGPNTTLFVVTQSPNRRGCLATAVDANGKRILWQRELGLVCQGPALPFGQERLALDQGGSVFAFNPANQSTRADVQWRVGGQSLAKPLPGNQDFPPSLHVVGDTVYEVGCPGKGAQLVVRRFQADATGKLQPPQDMDEKVVDLTSPPAGEAAVRGNSLLVPLQDGTIYRVKLPDCGPGIAGPEWRAARANAGLHCFVTWINDTDFLATDGARGVTHYRWAAGMNWLAFPENKGNDPTAEVRARIVTEPLVLPEAGADDLLVAVADASGRLTLHHGEVLEELRHWDLGGKITAGPFLGGKHIGCVVDGQKVMWVDPKRKEVVWEYQSGTAEPIVGEPQLVEDLLVVAHQSGRFVGLDPATGRPRGPGFTLQASAAPAVSPVAFGPGRAFAPLTDGTVLLLSLQHLRDPFGAFPVVW
jgi:outer membrane protein assembly factor BamB